MRVGRTLREIGKGNLAWGSRRRSLWLPRRSCAAVCYMLPRRQRPETTMEGHGSRGVGRGGMGTCRSAPHTATAVATPSGATTASSAKRGLRWTPGVCTPRPHRRRGTRRCGRGRTACGIRLFGVTGTRLATIMASITSRPRSFRSGRSSGSRAPAVWFGARLAGCMAMASEV